MLLVEKLSAKIQDGYLFGVRCHSATYTATERDYFCLWSLWLEDFFSLDFIPSPHRHAVYVCFADGVPCAPAIHASGKGLHVFMWHITVGAGTDRRLPQILSVSETHRMSDLYSRAALTCSRH